MLITFQVQGSKKFFYKKKQLKNKHKKVPAPRNAQQHSKFKNMWLSPEASFVSAPG